MAKFPLDKLPLFVYAKGSLQIKRHGIMEYFIKPFDSIVLSKRDSAGIIYGGNGITVECFHLK